MALVWKKESIIQAPHCINERGARYKLSALQERKADAKIVVDRFRKEGLKAVTKHMRDGYAIYTVRR